MDFMHNYEKWCIMINEVSYERMNDSEKLFTDSMCDKHNPHID